MNTSERDRYLDEVAEQLSKINDPEDENIASIIEEYERQLAPLQEERDNLAALVAELRAALEAYDPAEPPMLEGETPEQYTDRLISAGWTGTAPYTEHLNRQCSIGYHDECSDPKGQICRCPCHQFEKLREAALARTPEQAGERMKALEEVARCAAWWVKASDRYYEQKTAGWDSEDQTREMANEMVSAEEATEAAVKALAALEVQGAE